ncbi:MAG: pantetheine-phosphate adenylyltransferase [Fusobacteriota bacterium]
MEKKIAIYPGSFDLVTNGHLDIINRSVNLFDEVIIGVLTNYKKKTWFTSDQRVKMLKKIVKHDKIKIESFQGLLVNFANHKNANVIIRGLRAVSDYEYELQMALTNSTLSKEKVETVFLSASRDNLYLSSSLVKEIALNNGEISEFVDKRILEDICKKVEEIKGGTNDKIISSR